MGVREERKTCFEKWRKKNYTKKEKIHEGKMLEIKVKKKTKKEREVKNKDKRKMSRSSEGKSVF